MDPINVIVMGGGLLWLFTTAVREDWHRERFNKIRENTIFRLVVGGMIVFGTAWISRGAYAPSLVDPESTENKYVRITSIPSPDAQFECATLLEFGVNHVATEGFVARICPNVEDYRNWYGVPGKTHPQSEFAIPHFDPEGSALWVLAPEFAISPRTSYYVCLMAHRAEQCEPNDVLYFAIASNASRSLQSRQKAIGHQYTCKE